MSGKLDNVTKIEEISTSYSKSIEQKNVGTDTDKKMQYTGKITLDNDKINTYFSDNPNATYLEISYQLTTLSNNTTETLNFVIRVTKSTT